ncbi:MAG: hypothetical protein HKN29_01510, partial [Rhodothermales bacterium]|nr:hypothetical protein [Rhodothermales bacterium]
MSNRLATLSLLSALLMLAVLPLTQTSQAQTTLRNAESLQLRGVMFMDYNYVVSDPGDAAGDNGFGYRRVRLTSDYRVNSDMRVRVRLEADDDSDPYVKDLFLRWDNALGEGHRIIAGISNPPAYVVSEAFYGYRSLEKTIMDREKIVSSRDFGLSFQGPVGNLQYGLMIANNSSNGEETNRQKRVYGQIQSEGEALTWSIGGDYAALEGGSIVTGNAFVGYRFDGFRLGLEGYFSPVRPEDETGELDRMGVSVFGVASLNDKTEAILRYDFSNRDAMG